MPDPAQRASEFTSEERGALAAHTLDEAKTFMLASSLESAEREITDLESERVRLEKKRSPDQNRLNALSARVEQVKSLMPALIDRFEHSRASRAPVPQDIAIIARRVFDPSSRIGIANATVLATRPQGATIAKTVTDASGAFELALNEKAFAAVSLEVKSGRDTIYSDPKPAKLEPGQRYYRDIAAGAPSPSTHKGKSEAKK
jgi:hypothetical protein